ncbi:Imm32 family immunity protein [Riemerella anatipestifer]|uniref:Uncharacterized protein n=1 Tax=Riemerella anatipestifer TaxID=34085 RepID=A0AAP6LKB8_RIEAN|nr:hypothetical protein [Riemerella anatipestifer]MCD5969120.1 hypothetical protein [Riemerella anatipestifer]MCO7354339.1 hypothetical protein [Riemerella anatipestifer]MCU7539988.1 hypothetical protein [Riemerella anatipestifer]MCU7570226.1 hypothetical protein [Riemerella anatipestifer]MCU7597284.1 hypothetical protein [Riemerella anatipestifer]
MEKQNQIQGELDIFIDKEANEVLIHGTPKGLKSFAKVLLQLAELNQSEIDDVSLPVGAREHYHLIPNIDLSKSSTNVIVGRLDAKGSGDFYERFIPKKKH